MVFLGSLFKWN